jgi:hypothetical protein
MSNSNSKHIHARVKWGKTRNKYSQRLLSTYKFHASIENISYIKRYNFKENLSTEFKKKLHALYLRTTQSVVDNTIFK